MRAALDDDAPTEDDLRSFKSALTERGVDPDALRTNHKGTLFSPEPPAALQALLDGVEALPVLYGGERDELVLKAQLGKGGMGVVYAAEQTALGREVAVKRAARRSGPAGATTGGPARELIHEARVTGRLAHPNIIPVHALGRTADGDVLLVMKRVEGVEWSRLLDERPDDLEGHLEIFVDVCRAVELAHEQGVLHRDLKPANVMVGKHDEVYLLDWGLAVALRAGGDIGIPLASEVHDLVGTPAYMAPEMVLKGEIGERTDGFLLGAVLHELVTGRPPWTGDDTVEILLRASRCEPPALPDEVPREMRELLARALARDPAERFESVRALREAVEAFVEHESARRLTRVGDEIRAALDLKDALASLDSDALDEQLTRARFAYEQALEVWPDDPDARAGLIVLDELTARKRAEHKRLKARARDNDFHAGRGQRAPFVIAGGFIWGGLCLAAAALDDAGVVSAFPVLIGAVALVTLVFSVALRRRIVDGRANRADRTSSFITLGWIGVYAIILALCWWAGVPVFVPLVIGHLNFVVMQILMGFAFNRRLLRTIPVMFLSAVPLVIWPAYALWIHGALFGAVLVVLGLWLRGLARSHARQLR